MQQILLTIIITVLLTNSYSTLSLAKTYYSDPCISKGQQGVCKTWSDCPYIETLIKLGEYTVKEVVNCGFEGTGSNGEIICCPLDKSQFRKPPNNDDRSNTTETDPITVAIITTTKAPPIFMNLLQNTTKFKAFSADNNNNNNNQCVNCNSKLITDLHFQNSTGDNNIENEYIQIDNVYTTKLDSIEIDEDKNKINETKKQQLEELINNVFQINTNNKAVATTELNSFSQTYDTTIKPESSEGKHLINVSTDHFKFNNQANSEVTKQLRIPDINGILFQQQQQQQQQKQQQQQQQQQSINLGQSYKPASNIEQQPFIYNPQLLQQNMMGQPISTNQYQLLPLLQQKFQIQNFQFQLPLPPLQQINQLQQLNQLYQLLYTNNIWKLYTLLRNEFGQNQVLSNVGKQLTQTELEYYTRLLLQLQEQQKYNALGLSNQMPQQIIQNNQLQNPYGILSQPSLEGPKPHGQDDATIKNLMLNEMNFNPQVPSNIQSSTMASIPAHILNQMHFDPQYSIEVEGSTTEIVTVPMTLATAIDNVTLKPIFANYMEYIQPAIEQESHNSKNKLISQFEYDQLKSFNTIKNDHLKLITTTKSIDKMNDNANLNMISNENQMDNIWNVIKKESQSPSQSRQLKKSAKIMTIPHLHHTDDADRMDSQNIQRPKTTTTRTISVNDTRPAVQACNVLESGLFAFLTPHILGGIPSEWGEFPHMAAIGYSSVGEEGPPYEVKCGGTLISSRFILTAAHCVSRRYEIPKVVLLGVVNFTDPEQMQFLVQLAIKKTIIHDDYRLGSSYNDIALLELESRVEFTSYIYPSCLYTKPNDPLQSDILYVTGWGVINLTTRASSDVLLKARLKITPLDECDKRLREYGLPRQLDRGVPKSLMCAWDKNLQKDACQGDSGGPLNLQIDESTRNYRVVGIVISGFECASTTPGLYTRVSEYLDFIEKHVWPNREYDNADVEKFKQKNIKL